jgi:hypothetical protein
MISLNLHHQFVAAKTTACILFIFRSSKICVSPINVISSLFPPRRCLSSGRRRHERTGRVTLPSYGAKISLLSPLLSSGNDSPRHLPSQVKTEALNPYYRRRPPSLDCSTPTLHCYKKVISIMASFLTT